MSRTVQGFLTAMLLLTWSADVVPAALPPEVKKELTELSRELKEVSGLVKKKDIDGAKALIQKADDQAKELAISDDERDRSWTGFKAALEKARGLIPVSFEREIAPILKDNCLRCHGPEQQSANLRLDTFNMMARGGRSGAIVTGRDPSRSILTLRLIAENDQQRMPRGGAKLPDEQIQIIARWVEQGAEFDGENRDAPIGDSTVVKKPPVQVVKADGSETVSFKNDVAPILVNVCGGCHYGNARRGDFNYTSFEDLLQGGPTGNTIAPGDPDGSYIVDLTLRQDPIKMPQGQALLKRSQAQAIETWIREGARFDGGDSKAPLRSLVPTAAEMEAAKLAGMTDSEMQSRRMTQAAELWKQVSPQMEAISTTTDNFLLYGTASEERLKELGAAAETHLAALAKKYELPSGDKAFRGRLIVFVSAGRFEYEEFNTVLLDRRTPKAISGHAVTTPNFETMYVALHDVGDNESSSSLPTVPLMNSLISQAYLTRDGATMPDWLKQGFGLMESGMPASSDYIKALPARAATSVSTLTDAGSVFAEGTFKPEEVADVGYLIVRFLLSQGGPVRFQQLIGELRTNPSGPRAVQQVYGAPADQLGQAFLRSGG
jgi:hypothetical protein